MAWEENPRICLHMQLIAILSRTGVSFGKENKSNRDNSQNDKHDHTENIRADMSDDTYAIYDDNAP